MLLEMLQMLLQHAQESLLCEGLGQNIVHSWWGQLCACYIEEMRLTMLEVHANVIASNIGCHGDDGSGLIELSHKMSRGNSVEVRHDNVHQYEIILCTGVELIDSFKSVHLIRVSCVLTLKVAIKLTALSI